MNGNNDNDNNGFEEEDFVNLLSDVLLNTSGDGDGDDEIDGLEDLIPYISGLVSTQLQELLENESEVINEEQINELLEESMIPFF